MPVGDGEIHTEVSRRPEQKAAIGLLCSRGGFDGFASAVVRGEVPDMFGLHLSGQVFTDKTWDSKPKFNNDKEVCAAAYALKNECGSVKPSDPYDVALLEPLVRRPDCDPEVTKYLSFMGQQYYDALAQAIIREHLTYKIHAIGTRYGYHKDALADLYGKYLKSLGRDEEALSQAISLVVQDVGSVANDQIGKVDGWQGGVSLLANFRTNRFTTQFTADSSLSLINASHTLAHNNGSILEHMVDQSHEDSDSLALILLQAKQNDAVIYHHSSKYAQDLFRRESLNSVPQKESKEQELEILHAGIIDLFNRGKEPDNFLNKPEVLVKDISTELAANYGESARLLMDQLEFDDVIFRVFMIIFCQNFFLNHIKSVFNINT